MSPEQQCIAIAEWCGWKWYRIPHSEKNSHGPLKSLFHPAVHEIDQDPIWLQPGQASDRIATWEYMRREGMVPDYIKDLNAMHEAEDRLENKPLSYCLEYSNELRYVISHNGVVGDFRYVHATAAQRAEALLRTIGKWKE